MVVSVASLQTFWKQIACPLPFIIFLNRLLFLELLFATTICKNAKMLFLDSISGSFYIHNVADNLNQLFFGTTDSFQLDPSEEHTFVTTFYSRGRFVTISPVGYIGRK